MKHPCKYSHCTYADDVGQHFFCVSETVSSPDKTEKVSQHGRQAAQIDRRYMVVMQLTAKLEQSKA